MDYESLTARPPAQPPEVLWSVFKTLLAEPVYHDTPFASAPWRKSEPAKAKRLSHANLGQAVAQNQNLPGWLAAK